MYIWKLNTGRYLQLKDAYLSWITPSEIPEEAKEWLDTENLFYTKIPGEVFRLGPLNVKCQNLQIYLTSKCVMNCTFCMAKAFYEKYGTDPNADHYDIKAIEYYLDTLMPENIFFSGGEPPDYIERLGHLITLLKTKYSSKVRIILDTCGDHPDLIKYIHSLYPNMLISVTAELPRIGEDKNYRGQDFYKLCDDLEDIRTSLKLTDEEFSVKPYFVPYFDPSYYEYLHNKNFVHVETDVYHQVRPNVEFPHYSTEDIKQAIKLIKDFPTSINPGDTKPLYASLVDTGNPCIKNMSFFKQLEKDWVCRHDYDGTYSEGSLENYYENKVSIYKKGLGYGEEYCGIDLKDVGQSTTAIKMIKSMTAAVMLQHFNYLGEGISKFVEETNAEYSNRDVLLGKMNLELLEGDKQTGEVMCHLTDEYYNVTKLDIERYIHFLGLSHIEEVYFDDFRNAQKYKDETLLVLTRPFGFYTLTTVGIKSEIMKKKSKTYWYNSLLGECVDESLQYTVSRG